MFEKFGWLVTNVYIVRNEEVRRRVGIERELARSRSESIEMVWACGQNK